MKSLDFLKPRKYPILSKEKEKELFLELKSKNNKNAKDLLVKHNMRLVVSIAKKYDKYNFEDNIQNGVLGLLYAIKNFNIERGIRFSTYATFWVKSFISRATKENNFIHLPELFYLTDKASKLIKQQTPYSLSDCINSSEMKYEEILPSSINTHKIVENKNTADYFKSYMKDTLTDREYNIINLRNKDIYTFMDIGNKLGLSGEGVRKIYNKALTKLEEYKETLLER